MLIKLSCCDVRVYHSSSICSVYFDMFDLTNLHGSLCRPISEFKDCTQKERNASIQLEAVFKDWGNAFHQSATQHHATIRSVFYWSDSVGTACRLKWTSHEHSVSCRTWTKSLRIELKGSISVRVQNQHHTSIQSAIEHEQSPWGPSYGVRLVYKMNFIRTFCQLFYRGNSTGTVCIGNEQQTRIRAAVQLECSLNGW